MLGRSSSYCPTNLSESALRVASSSGKTNSSSALFLLDRPEGLPAKPEEERRRHQFEYISMLEESRRKDEISILQQKHSTFQKLNEEERQHQLTALWKSHILPEWTQGSLNHKNLHRLIQHGVPLSVRGEVWQRLLQDDLGFTELDFEELRSQLLAKENLEKSSECKIASVNQKPCSFQFEIGLLIQRFSSATDCILTDPTVSVAALLLPWLMNPFRHCPTDDRKVRQSPAKISASNSLACLRHIRLDLPRTFPHLCLFQSGCPYHRPLFELLGAFVCYRPDIGYVQGMSFLGSTLLMVMDLRAAFVCLANLLLRPCLFSFYSLEEAAIDLYLGQMDRIVGQQLPRLHRHLHTCRMDALLRMLFMEWILTLFSKCLPLEAVLPLWDFLMLEGEVALPRCILALLITLETVLLGMDFDEMAGLLTTNPLPVLRVNSNSSPCANLSVDQLIAVLYSTPKCEWPQPEIRHNAVVF